MFSRNRSLISNDGTDNNNSRFQSVQTLVRFGSMHMGVAARMAAARDRRLSSVVSFNGGAGRPLSRGDNLLDEYGGRGGLHPISFTRELAFGLSADQARIRKGKIALVNGPCVGRLILVILVFLLGLGIYFVRYLEKNAERRLLEKYLQNESALSSFSVGADNSDNNIWDV